MGKLGAVGVGLCVVFAAIMVVIAIELYYMWRKRGRKKMWGGFRSKDVAVAAAARAGSGEDPEAAAEGWGMVWLVMSKRGMNVQMRRAGMEEEELGGCGAMAGVKEQMSLKERKGQEGLDEEEEEEEDIFKMAGMWGQPRFLFTIAEETEEEEAGSGEEDDEDGHGRSRSCCCSSSSSASPYLTPPSSPPFSTPLGSPAPSSPFLFLYPSHRYSSPSPLAMSAASQGHVVSSSSSHHLPSAISAGLQLSASPPPPLSAVHTITPSVPAAIPGGIARPSTSTSTSAALPESSPMAIDIGNLSNATAAVAGPLSASSPPSAIHSADLFPAHSLTVDVRLPKTGAVTGNSLSVDVSTISSMSTGLPAKLLSFTQEGVDLKPSDPASTPLPSDFASSSPPETAPASLDLVLREDPAKDVGAVSVSHRTVDFASSASTVATAMALRNPSLSLLPVDRSSSPSPPVFLEASLPPSLVSIPSSSSASPSSVASTAPHPDAAAYFFISPKRQQRRPLSLLFDPPPSPSSALNYHCHSRVHPLSPPRTGNASIECNPLSNFASKPQEPEAAPVSSVQSASSSPFFQIPDVSQPTTPTPFRHILQQKRV